MSRRTTQGIGDATTNERLLTRREAAQFLRLRPETLGMWAWKKRHLPVVKVGRACRYRLADLKLFIEQRTIEPK